MVAFHWIKKKEKHLSKKCWIDEIKINLYENDAKENFWRKRQIAHIIHGRGNVMVWACTAEPDH